MENQMTISTICDEFYDDVIIYKLFNNPTLLESLKRIESVKLFKTLKPFCSNELKVCILYYSHN